MAASGENQYEALAAPSAGSEAPAAIPRAAGLKGMCSAMTSVYPIIMSGGSGSRLWPVSREHYPKQFLPLCSDRSMIQDTAQRVSDPGRFAPLSVICNEEHRFIVAEQMRRLGAPLDAIILEPVGRNTAAAAAVCALRIVEQDPEGVMLLLPADHLIRDSAAFQEAIDRAAGLARERRLLVTFGIVPQGPHTGYGYIRRAGALTAGAYQVASFVEKPDAERARAFVESGEYSWNSGMFVFPARLYLEELERHEPAVLAACRAALAGGGRDLDFFRLDAAAFARSPAISIDNAVMERTAAAAVVPCDIGWTDVGSWTSLWEVADKDADGNASHGDVALLDSRNCYVRSEGAALVTAIGVEDVVIVATDDAVLVADSAHTQDIKRLVERLKKEGRREPQAHVQVHRPWGYYQSIHTGERFQVKRLTVAPGAQLSLQKHYHRSEHWVVVNGTAQVTRDDETLIVQENESVYIPLGATHRLANPGKIPLTVIEVQSGSYLGEDDIVRTQDSYGRA